MTSLVRITAIVLVLAFPFAAQAQSVERGRALYENHCITCHTEKVHARTEPLARNRDELRGIVTRWAYNAGLAWKVEEVEDVVHYLGTTRYRF